MKIGKLPDIEHIREALDYCKESGSFTWKFRPPSHFPTNGGYVGFNARYANKPAGTVSESGYLRIRIGGRSVMAHRIAVLLNTGVDPGDARVDHIDGNKLNNSEANLRLANSAQNIWNTPKRSNNKSGLKGIFKHNQYDKYVAMIRREYLGVFNTKEEAYQARLKREIELYGEFAYIEKTNGVQ